MYRLLAEGFALIEVEGDAPACDENFHDVEGERFDEETDSAGVVDDVYLSILSYTISGIKDKANMEKLHGEFF